MTPTIPTSTGSNDDGFSSPSFSCGVENGLRPDHKRRHSSSSGIADDSSTNDENTCSESSIDSLASRRKVSFRLAADKVNEDSEKIRNRRLSAPVFGNPVTTSSAFDLSPYHNMFHPGTPNWLYPNPYTSPLLGYQEFFRGRSYLSPISPGYLSPMYPAYSPGGIYSPFSPFLKRASSFPNIVQSGETLYHTIDGVFSPRIPHYDPFSYFLSNPISSRRSYNTSPVESLGKKEDDRKSDSDACETETKNENETRMELVDDDATISHGEKLKLARDLHIRLRKS